MNWKETKCSKFSIKFFLSSLAKGEREPFPINIVWNPQYQQKQAFLHGNRLGMNFDD